MEGVAATPVCNFTTAASGGIVRLVLDDPIEGHRWYCEANDAQDAYDAIKHEDEANEYEVELERMEEAIQVMRWWEKNDLGQPIPVDY